MSQPANQASAAASPLLSVDNLSKQYPVKPGLFKRASVSAVDDVSFSVGAGETLGVVGESGCGKSTTARLILGLIEPNAGDVRFQGRDVRRAGGAGRKELKRHMQMVFQDPYSSVNPRMAIGENIAFPMRVHGYDSTTQRERTAHLLEQVGLHANHASYFPHQMSGGQLQRVNIARALALEPQLLICDEPVSALDKSIQAQVINLLQDLQAELKLTYIFISHDLNVVEYMSNRVLVMYMGRVVESCSSAELYRQPLHPYTRLLLESIPSIHAGVDVPKTHAEGEIPSPLNPPSGCRFHTRCPFVMDICKQQSPPLQEVAPGHVVACHLHEPAPIAVSAD
jgi:oligopeptide/dipeptide ABC transporter ATP-binding protein